MVWLLSSSSTSFQSTLPVWGATWEYPSTLHSKYISIHAPRVGSDILRQCTNIKRKIFQSTLPVWGATMAVCQTFWATRFQSTLPVWGATEPVVMHYLWVEFQSTLPVWGATSPLFSLSIALSISIHAPRVGSDRL